MNLSRLACRLIEKEATLLIQYNSSNSQEKQIELIKELEKTRRTKNKVLFRWTKEADLIKTKLPQMT